MGGPCKNCTDRVVGCHAKCGKYIAWRKPFDDAQAERERLRPASDFRTDEKYKGYKKYKLSKQKGGR